MSQQSFVPSAQPKVSIIIPVCNVQTYLAECLDSAIHQTLTDIEIICVDDGSTDRSAEILDEYAEKDPRIVVIHKANAGYGHTMNVGLDRARGKYVAFLESDDFMVPDAYEVLYTAAERTGVDIIKANYSEVRGSYPDYRIVHKSILTSTKLQYDQLYCPEKEPRLFYVPMMNVLGLFRREMLETHHIRHNETPGASHQDMGFWFQTFCMAKSVSFIDRNLYQYRQDNPNSSINNRNKVFCVRDEYRFLWAFLERNPDVQKWSAPVYFHRMFGSFLFTYNKLVDTLKPLFLYDAFRADFLTAQTRSAYTEARFSPDEKRILALILNAPEVFLAGNASADVSKADLAKALAVKQRQLSVYQKEKHDALSAETQTAARAARSSSVDLSVIIPVYNTADYLEACLDSVLAQPVRSMEILCVNDGSTDESLSILQRYAEKDSRIRVFSQSNMGQSAARNKALDEAVGEYVYFMDSDDLLAPDALNYLYDEAKKQQLDLLLFDAESFYETGDLAARFKSFADQYSRSREWGDVYTGLEMMDLLHADNSYYVSPCLQLVRRQHIEENHLRFYEGIIYEDNLFFIENLLSAARVSHRKKRFFRRRIRLGSTMTNQKTQRNVYGYLICYIEMIQLWRRYQNVPGAPEQIQIEIGKIKRTMRKYYGALPLEEKKALAQINPVEYAFLRSAVGPLPEDPLSSAKLQKKYKKAQRTLQSIQSSSSYRIGRVITFLPRKAKQVFRLGRKKEAAAGSRRNKENADVLVSVIIPVYNVAPYLGECLDSLLRQTLTDIEIICVDDGSTDDSLSILRDYEKKDRRIKVLTQKNAGAGIARNYGMTIARGKYLSILDADDLFDAAMLKKAYNTAEKDGAEIVMFRHDRYDHQEKRRFNLAHMMNKANFPEENPFSVFDMNVNFYMKIQGWTWDKLFLRSFVEKNGLRFQGTRSYNDMYFTFSALVSAKRISFLNETLMCQRVNRPGAITKTVQNTWPCVFEALSAVKEYLIRSGKYPDVQERFTTYALHMILFNYRQLDGEAKQELVKSFRSRAKKELGIDLSDAAGLTDPAELEEARKAFL